MSPKVTEEHREERRRQILEAAERVFARKGYEPATLKDIVEEADMSRGWIYLYFQTKEQIFEALIAKSDSEDEIEFGQKLSNSSTVWEAIESMVQRLKQELTASEPSAAPAFYEYYISGWRDEARRIQFARRYDEATARVAQLLETGVTTGEFMPQLPVETIAKVMGSQLDGIQLHTLAVGPDRTDPSAQLDALIDCLKQLLGVRSAE